MLILLLTMQHEFLFGELPTPSSVLWNWLRYNNKFIVWNLDVLVSYENYGCVPENSFASHTTHYSSPKHEIKG